MTGCRLEDRDIMCRIWAHLVSCIGQLPLRGESVSGVICLELETDRLPPYSVEPNRSVEWPQLLHHIRKFPSSDPGSHAGNRH